MGVAKTRTNIVQAADQLFYRQGYEHTSFSHIADAVQISRGNFYHHFKTKDAILDAVIEERLARTRNMLARWEGESKRPQDHIKSYMRILLVNWDKIEHFGCPVGTLSTELAKLNHASQAEARQVFTLFRDWLRTQFLALGHRNHSDELAMHVIAWSQGVATLGQAFRDTDFVKNEVEKKCVWLDTLSSGEPQPVAPR